MKQRNLGLTVLAVIILGVALFCTIARNKNSVIGGSVRAWIDSMYRVETVDITKKDSIKRYTYKILHIDLNSASQEELIKVYGIGKVFSRRIIEYREKLGGFYSVEQLKEVYGIDNEVYDKIFSNFYIKDCSYSKIYINFATLNRLETHPYITPSMARRIEKARKRGGYFNNAKELIDNDILLPNEARKVTPYFCYDTVKNRKKQNLKTT